MVSMKWLSGAALAATAIGAGTFGAGPALAADCAAAGARDVKVGTLQPLGSGEKGVFAIDLKAGEGVWIELDPTMPAAADDEDGAKTPPTGLKVCDASGKQLAPRASDVFASGGALSKLDDGTLRLAFLPAAAGRYTIVADAVDDTRELLVRDRDVAEGAGASTRIEMGGSDFAKVSSAKPLVYAVDGKAGQWVKITVQSEADTVLHLAAPMAGGYTVIADNDDSDGLNPRIVRKLPVTGTYYIQVESLGDDAADATVLIEPTQAPPPPPPPAPIKAGQTVKGTLADGDARNLYRLPVVAGHTYTLKVDAPFDAVLEAGVPDPLEADGDDDSPNGFAALRTVDNGTSGEETLTFTARATGTLLVQVRSFGIDNGADYTLSASEPGA